MWPNPQFPADLVTFTEEILNGKLHFLYSVSSKFLWPIQTLLADSLSELGGNLIIIVYNHTDSHHDSIFALNYIHFHLVYISNYMIDVELIGL